MDEILGLQDMELEQATSDNNYGSNLSLLVC
ncbi:SapB/AmfS family lantipeptide [Pseudonocardiaceae bacterium YIM PH 21723]|nr:SapB/AmfS family lantipeptide [Pseudonocardiaceae bacterium YIM PH 21723]